MKRVSLVCLLIFAAPLVAPARAAEVGLLNNAAGRLTFSPLESDLPLAESYPAVLPGVLNSFDSWYFGAGHTHSGPPSILWQNDPTDLGLTIVGIEHDGTPVTSGFQLASGELDAFQAIFVDGTAPTNLIGLGDTLLFVPASVIADAQSGDPSSPSYENHHHTYAQADSAGIWDVTLVLTDLGASPLYADSDPFTVRWVAVPEPGAAALLFLGLVALRRRRASQRVAM